MTVLLTREAAIGAKIEVTEGTAETLAAADAIVLPYDIKFTPDVPVYKRKPHRSKLTGLAGIPGRKIGKVTFRSEFKGSGAVATVPEWDVFARICGLARSTVDTLPIGAITGTFQGGETATLVGSGAVVRICGDQTGTPGVLRVVVVSGVPANLDVATGATSGATCTLSGAKTAAQGYEYLPTSSEPPTATVAVWRDGKRNSLVGCRGTWKKVHKADEPVFWEWEVMGVWTGETDEDVIASIPYQEVTPASWEAVSFKVGNEFAAIVEALTIDIGNSLEPRVSANATHGVLSILRPTREAKAEFDPENNLVADHDWLGRFRAGTTGRLSYTFGSGTGKRLAVTCPCVQYVGAEENDRAGLQTLKMKADLVSPTIAGGDDEIQVVMY